MQGGGGGNSVGVSGFEIYGTHSVHKDSLII